MEDHHDCNVIGWDLYILLPGPRGFGMFEADHNET